MQIKYQQLAQHLQKRTLALYVLIGQEPYLLNESALQIKSTLKKTFDCDDILFSIQSVDDWNKLTEKANNYSLFSDKTLLNITYDKKTLDASGKKVIAEYLKQINDSCFIILTAPNTTAKQWQWLLKEDLALLVVSAPLNMEAMRQWINQQLKVKSLQYEPQIVELIYQYTQGNMLACAQVIEKISLDAKPHQLIKAQDVLEHLSDQCMYSLFELVEACLMGQHSKVIHILRQAANNKTEMTLMLWMLTQEIRLLSQLTFAMHNKRDFKETCSQLKIWPQRINLYYSAYKKVNNQFLTQLLNYCTLIDEQIKSNQNTHVWAALEKLALSLSLGKLCIP